MWKEKWRVEFLALLAYLVAGVDTEIISIIEINPFYL
jgi:hypothetical protein